MNPKHHVFVRPAEAKDAQQVIEWSLSTPANEWDPEVGRYKNSYTLCAFDEDGPLCYLPVQQPQMLESLAVRPGAENWKVAQALRQLVQTVITQSYIKGSGEVYFMDTNPDTSEFAENQLFTPLPWKVYRVKLKDLEGKQCSTPAS